MPWFKKAGLSIWDGSSRSNWAPPVFSDRSRTECRGEFWTHWELCSLLEPQAWICRPRPEHRHHLITCAVTVLWNRIAVYFKKLRCGKDDATTAGDRKGVSQPVGFVRMSALFPRITGRTQRRVSPASYFRLITSPAHDRTGSRSPGKVHRSDCGPRWRIEIRSSLSANSTGIGTNPNQRPRR